MPNQSTAVKTGVGRVSAVPVWRADKADGIDSNVMGLLLGESRRQYQSFDGSRTSMGHWHSAASCESEEEKKRTCNTSQADIAESIHAATMTADTTKLNTALVSSTWHTPTRKEQHRQPRVAKFEIPRTDKSSMPRQSMSGPRSMFFDPAERQ